MGLSLARLMPSATVTTEDKTAAELMVARDEVRRHQKRLQALQINTRETAKQYLKEGKRDKAVVTVRKLKWIQTGLSTCDEQLLRLEQLSLQIDESARTKEVFEAMRAGTDLLQEINRKLTVEDVTQLKEDTESAYAYQQEVEAALMGDFGESLEELETVPETVPRAESVAKEKPRVSKEVLPA